MQKEIQLTDKTLLVVGLPETTKHVGMMCDNLRVEFVRKDGSTWDYNYGKYVGYELLGIYPELTEEQAKIVVELHSITRGQQFGYKDYLKSTEKIDHFTCSTAKESCQSLMEREKCYTVNPYGGKRPNLNDYDIPYASQDYMDLLQMEIGLSQRYWEEAQQTTFDKYAILIKSK